MMCLHRSQWRLADYGSREFLRPQVKYGPKTPDLLLGIVWLILSASPPMVCAQTQAGPPATLSPEALTQGYLQQQALIRNLHVRYAENLFKREETDLLKDRKEFSKATEHQFVDRFQEGDKYYIRFSKSDKGFVDKANLVDRSYDGRVTRIMWGEKLGEIYEGQTGSSLEELNAMDQYTLAYKLEADGIPPFTRFEDMVNRGANARVRPAQELVNGHYCHVVESLLPNGQLQHLVYVASEAGFLPVRHVSYADGRLFREVNLDEIQPFQSDEGQVWFPFKARKKQQYLGGYLNYEFNVDTVEINQPMDIERFRVQFPPGTRVRDLVADTEYRVEDVALPELAVQQMVAAVKEAEAVPASQSASEQAATRPAEDGQGTNSKTSGGLAHTETGQRLGSQPVFLIIAVICAAVGLAILLTGLLRGKTQPGERARPG